MQGLGEEGGQRPPFSLPTTNFKEEFMTHPIAAPVTAPVATPVVNRPRWFRAAAVAGLLIAGLAVLGAPAHAQRCFNQNGQTICCDNSGNCYAR